MYEGLADFQTLIRDREFMKLLVMLRSSHLDNDNTAAERPFSLHVTQQHDRISDCRDMHIGDLHHGRIDVSSDGT